MKQEKLGISRRGFLTGAASIGAVSALGALTACASESASNSNQPTEAVAADNSATETSSDWLGQEPSIDESAITQTVDTEILVVGGGTGGLFAACAAAEEGAQVLVIDKYKSGGIRDDLGAVNTRYQQETGTVMDPQELVREAYHYSAGRIVPDLHYLWARESGEAIDWYGDRLADRDVVLWQEYTEEKNEVNYKHFPTGHSPEWPVDDKGSKTLDGATVLTDYATEQGVEFLYYTPMVKLVKEGNAVTGVIAQDTETEEYIQINASKGVIICTGGYAGNHEMLAARQPDTYNLLGWEMIIPGSTGDGIKACIWAGADYDKEPTSMLFDRCALPVGTYPTGPDSGGSWFWMGEQPFLKVNLNGERFCNESGVYDYIAHAAAKQPNRTYVTLWDANFKEDCERFDMHGCSRLYPNDNGAPPNIPMEVVAGMTEGLVEDGVVQKADTLEELAEKLQLPVDALVATVDRYNEMYEKGVDEDYGKEGFRLSAIKDGPFYGTWACAHTLCTLDGIRIDTEMRALDTNGEPIPGLYVIGNDSGGYYAYTYFNLATGHACGRTVTFGRHVGRALAQA